MIFFLILLVDIRMRPIFVSYEWHFYRDGFRAMTWGRVLWVIILLKLFILFVVLKLFFFPDFIRESSGTLNEDEFVSRELIGRMPSSDDGSH